jgi:hypothetical protein
VQFLVDAAAFPPPAAAVLPVPATPPRRSFDERMAVVIGLFERQAAQGRAYR